MADWYAATDGTAGGAGTLASPWDLATALADTTNIGGGDTLWLRGGTYVHPTRTVGSLGYDVQLKGTAGNYVTVRPYRSEHVTIDGGLHSALESTKPEYLIIRDLEVIVSENLTETRTSTISGSEAPTDLVRPWGGIDLSWGLNIRLINNVIHHNMQGIGLWKNVTGESELYGNIVYENGWIAPDRTHGHGIYSQNAYPAEKEIQNNVLGLNYSLNAQIYGGGTAFTENYRFRGNIGWGEVGVGGDVAYKSVLIGGTNPAANGRFSIDGNVLFHAVLQVTYIGVEATDVRITDNTIVMGKLEAVWVNRAVIADNFLWEEFFDGTYTGELKAAPEGGAATPTGPWTFLFNNRYDPYRAHLAIMNFFEVANVDVDLSGCLNVGDTFRLMDPTDFWGTPAYSGTWQGTPLSIPMANQQFVARIVLRDPPTGGTAGWQ